MFQAFEDNNWPLPKHLTPNLEIINIKNVSKWIIFALTYQNPKIEKSAQIDPKNKDLVCIHNNKVA